MLMMNRPRPKPDTDFIINTNKFKDFVNTEKS